MPDHISWRDVIQVDSDEDLLVYDLSTEEFQDKVAQLENFLDFVECTEMGQVLLGDIREQQAVHNNAEKVHIKLSDNRASGATPDGTIIVNTNTPEYIAFINQASEEATPVSLERVVLHELYHISDDRLQTVGAGDVLAEEYATRKTDEFACAYMPSLGQRVAYMNGAGEVPESNHNNVTDGEYGMDLIQNDAYTRDLIVAAIEDLPERIKGALQDAGLAADSMPNIKPCDDLVPKN